MEKNIQQRATDCLRVVLYGPESTGKTTLAKALAEQGQTSSIVFGLLDYQNHLDSVGLVFHQGRESRLRAVLGEFQRLDFALLSKTHIVSE